MKPHLRITVETLLLHRHQPTRDRAAYRRRPQDHPRLRPARWQIPPGWPPALTGRPGKLPPPGHRLQRRAADRGAGDAARSTRSACEPHRAWIEAQVGLGPQRGEHLPGPGRDPRFRSRLQRGQALRRRLKARAPERFDVLEFPPGEEAQVDYGQGALTLDASGKYRRPYLFVMTLKYSGKSFRKVVWKTSQETWARLHEEAFRALGGCPKYVVLDNLKEGVITPDLYPRSSTPCTRRCWPTTASSPIPAGSAIPTATRRHQTVSCVEHCAGIRVGDRGRYRPPAPLTSVAPLSGAYRHRSPLP